MVQTYIGVGQMSYISSFDYYSDATTVTAATYGTTFITKSVRIDMEPKEEGEVTFHDGSKMSWTAHSHSAVIRAQIYLSTTSKVIYKALTTTQTPKEGLTLDFQAEFRDADGTTLVTINEVSGSRVQVYCDGEHSLEGGAFVFELVIKADEVVTS